MTAGVPHGTPAVYISGGIQGTQGIGKEPLIMDDPALHILKLCLEQTLGGFFGRQIAC